MGEGGPGDEYEPTQEVKSGQQSAGTLDNHGARALLVAYGSATLTGRIIAAAVHLVDGRRRVAWSHKAAARVDTPILV